MLADMFKFGIGIALIQQAGSVNHGSGWRLLTAIVLTIAGAELIWNTAVRYERRRSTPFKWHCKNCHDKGDLCELRASDEATLERAVHHHNRTIHLMEP